MGKASKWFRALFAHKKSSTDSSSPSSAKPPKEKRRWSFVKSYREKDQTTLHNHNHHHPDAGDQPHTTRGAASHNQLPDVSGEDFSGNQDKHAIAVAAATAAVAEAAVAAAQAAAAVVRLTRGGAKNPAAYVRGSGAGIREEWAAVKIQSAFRGCLARRALRALKGLVKLQALVRGHIERKRTAEWLHRMQALLQAQARAIGGRSQLSEFQHSNSKSSNFHHPGPATPEKFEHVIRSKSRKHDQPSLLRKSSSKSNGRTISDHDRTYSGGSRSESQLDERSGNLRSSSVRNPATDDEKSDRILEIDTGKPHITPKRRNLFHSSDQYSHSFTTSKDSTTHYTLPSPSSYEVQSLTPLKLSNNDVEEASFCTANNSPQFYSASSKGASSRRSPFTPSKSDGSRSFLSGYSDYPNYMACTESSKAKLRSLSAPKQRPQYERSSSVKRYSIHGVGESRQSGQSISTLHANFMNKAYPGSGRLDKLGMPIGYRY